MKKPEHDYYDIEDLIKKLEPYDNTITETDLLKYGAKGQLQFSLRTFPSGDINSISYYMFTEILDGDPPLPDNDLPRRLFGKEMRLCKECHVTDEKLQLIRISTKTINDLIYANKGQHLEPTLLPMCNEYQKNCTKDCTMTSTMHFDPNSENTDVTFLSHDSYEEIEIKDEFPPGEFHSRTIYKNPHYFFKIKREELVVAHDEVKRFEEESLKQDDKLSPDIQPENEKSDDKKLPSNDIEQELKNLTIRYENDTHITIQKRSKPKISVDLTHLRFKLKTNPITWKNFLKVLKDPPFHYWRCPKDADKKQIKVISDRLIEWISNNLNITFPDKYRLHEIVKSKESGTYRFKFNIVYSDTIEIDESSKETFREKFFFNIEDYKKSPTELKMEKNTDMASKGLIKKFLTEKEIMEALKIDTPTDEKDMIIHDDEEDMTIYDDEENMPMDLSQDDGGELNF